MLLPLRRDQGHIASLVTDYSVAWKPLIAPAAGTGALREAGASLGRALRFGPPVLLEALDAEQPGLAPLLEGFRAARMLTLRFSSFGNWHEALQPDMRWDAYLGARPAALRNTIARKLARAERHFAWELVSTPGQALETGIAAYVAVRATSWKPDEPFPDFDAALLRVLAGAGALRLGVLRESAGGRAVAAQYWVLDHGGEANGLRATVLKLAHDDAARSSSPGTVLTALMIRHLIEQDAVRSLDFGRGDDAYKRLWVARRRGRVGYVLADPMHPLGLAAIARQAAGAARSRLRRWSRSRPSGAT
ncbi:GNAT family N-acetyltransferase [Roseomonas sp. CAU 1739]|uniref:GNAT family N-acetyltransferase n=1 Tax=Roseomonas sp. CAU 1739 TaxID=3140364 RepID=UPI00325A5ADE